MIDKWEYFDDVEKKLTIVVNTIKQEDGEVATDVYISELGCDLIKNDESIHDQMQPLQPSKCGKNKTNTNPFGDCINNN